MKPNEIVTSKRFKELSLENKLGNEILRKTYDSEIKVIDEKKGIANFIISTEAVDRDGDTVSVDGWDLSNFEKNPVVLWAHDHSQPPVAKATDIFIKNGSLMATTEFTPADLYPFGDMVYRMILGGFLNATSVGFMPKEFAFSKDADRNLGMDFSKTELLEYSIVPIPSNPEALLQAKSTGINLNPLVEWSDLILDNEKKLDHKLSLTRKQIEEIRSYAKEDDNKVYDLSPQPKALEEDPELEVEVKEASGDDKIGELIARVEDLTSKIDNIAKTIDSKNIVEIGNKSASEPKILRIDKSLLV